MVLLIKSLGRILFKMSDLLTRYFQGISYCLEAFSYHYMNEDLHPPQPCEGSTQKASPPSRGRLGVPTLGLFSVSPLQPVTRQDSVPTTAPCFTVLHALLMRKKQTAE